MRSVLSSCSHDAVLAGACSPRAVCPALVWVLGTNSQCNPCSRAVPEGDGAFENVLENTYLPAYGKLHFETALN